MNETLRVIADRYSCRDFKPDRLPDEALRAIALAAVQSPSGMNNQPWRAIVVRDQRLMDEFEAEGMRILKAMDDQSAYNRIMGRGGRIFYGAPAMVVVPIQPGAELDCGIVCQSIALAAASLSIGSVICGMASLPLSGGRGAEFIARLGFPEGYVFGCSVLLGYANTKKPPHEPDESKISFIG
ncbi:MAG: nitroreductase [Clostridiales bacterium]|nr:nitroreductase [Clostridiales bacterium]